MIHADLPADLTFEQFKALAMREPDLSGDWIYELEANEFDDEATALYPCFELYSTSRCFFRSLDEAEKYMREELVTPSVYRFVITQRPVGRLSNEHGAQWLYDHTGALIDRTITRWDSDGGMESLFFGRPAGQLRFKGGDIVEVVGRDKVNLGVVVGTPYPLEWYWENYLKHGKEYYFDASDEANYYILEGPGYMHHVHANTISLMSPRWPVPDDIRRYFEHSLRHADDEDYEEVYRTNYFGDNEIGLLGRNEIDIIYDASTRRHRLTYICDDAIMSDNDKRMLLPGMLDAAQLGRLTRWLSEVMYGRTRLWYLIRHWNENCCNYVSQPQLPLDTTIEQLLKQ